MFPIHDDNPTELVPIVTLGIIGVCVAVWPTNVVLDRSEIDRGGWW